MKVRENPYLPAALSACLVVALVTCDQNRPVAPDVELSLGAALGHPVNAPSNTKAVAASESRIEVSWWDNSPNEAGFEVWRSPNGVDGTFTKLAEAVANATTYTDAGLNPVTQYCYRLRTFSTFRGKTRYSGFSNAACATTAAAAGALQITTTTTGSDPDADGYLVRVDDGPDEAMGANATITIADISSGDHTVLLHGVSGNCSVEGTNPRAISVTSGATTEVAFMVSCVPVVVVTLEVTVVTTGVDFDADGYRVIANRTCWGTADCLRCPTCGNALVPVNGTVTISGLQPAHYLVELVGVASNCTVSGENPRIVAVPGAVSFDVACSPRTPVPPGMEVCDNGLDDDGDGWTDWDDPDCFCAPRQECYSMECPPGHFCDFSGCCYYHCEDGVHNGGEADLDCGADCPNQCQNGQMCAVDADCASGHCGVNDVCVP